MKKFLSLVLALIMTMSLVTIGASAAEYDDFTDKDEIQYEEAVAVLNRLGIITGYSEGDFRPEGELTRGAAAKIIVSLLIGPDAAENVVPTTAPYKDVPLDHTFAGVISYCKTAGIISGYSDGSFQPGGTLTGYAFSKMLLGALGYDTTVERFTGSGWTMRVNALGSEAGLFDRLVFKGNDAVNREEAAQLALNTLKATIVEYKGGMTVTAGDASVVTNPERTYKTSNQDYATHIYTKQTDVNQNGWYTVEFGEEHFVDLRLEHDKIAPKTPTPNDMGQPSAEWSYRKVTIGTYPLTPDFTFDHQMAHEDSNSDAAKERALGLSGYKTEILGSNGSASRTTQLWVNGMKKTDVIKVADIADYTDNGTVVEVYIDNQNADFISDVVVIQTQLMEVRRIGSDYVSLQKYDDNKGLENRAAITGFNQAPIDETVENVEVNDDYYEFLSGLKAGDAVAVIPVAINNHATGNDGFNVWEAYTPESVSGKLSKVTTYGKDSEDRNAVDVTVGGTAYKIALWNKDLKDVRAEDIQVTANDVTLLLDKTGNALLAKDVGDTSEYMVLKGFYSTTVNNRIVTVAEGWDMSGNELNLNLGVNGRTQGAQPGDLVQYTNLGTSSTADWALNVGHGDGNDSPYIYDVNWKYNQSTYDIKASNTRIALEGATVTDKMHENNNSLVVGNPVEASTIASGIKFIYVNFNQEGDEVESIEIIKGVQNVSNEELRTAQGGRSAEAYTDNKGAVKAVVIKDVSSNVISNRVAYVRDWDGEETYDNGKRLYRYTVAMTSPDGYEDSIKVWTDEKLSIGDFASYTASTREGYEPFYSMHKVNAVSGKVTTALYNVLVHEMVDVNTGLVRIDCTGKTGDDANIFTQQGTQLGIGDMAGIVRLDGANWLYQGSDKDSNGKRVDIRSAKELDNYLKDHPGKKVQLSFVFNDNVTNDGFRSASLVIVRAIDVNAVTTGGTNVTVNRYSGTAFAGTGTGDSLVETLTNYNLGSLDELSYVQDGKTVKFTLSQKAYAAGNYDQATIDVTKADGTTTTISATATPNPAPVASSPAVNAVVATSVTSAATYATALASADLYVYTGEGTAATDTTAANWTTIDHTATKNIREEVTYTNQAALDAAAAGGKLYTAATGGVALPTDAYVDGDYTAINVDATDGDFNQAAWDALIEAGLWTADPGNGDYTETGKVAAGTAMPSGATNAYFTYTAPEGTKFVSAATKYYLEKTVPAVDYVADTTYYTAKPVAAVTEVKGSWDISFAMPAYNFVITDVTLSHS